MSEKYLERARELATTLGLGVPALNGRIVSELHLKAVAALCAEIEAETREACARIADKRASIFASNTGLCSEPLREEAEDIASAIRAAKP